MPMPRRDSLASLVRSWPKAKQQAWLASLTPQQAHDLTYSWDFWARPDQRLPPGDWVTWLITSGRGWGKTRCGAQTLIEWLSTGTYHIAALIGATAADVRDVMVCGPSGVLACSPPWYRPDYQPSKRLLTWPDGKVAHCYSAEEPDRLRGPQHACGWLDEVAAWRYDQETYDQAMFGMRLGHRPRVIVTTTPRPKKLIRDLIADPTTHLTRRSTYDNVANLAPSFTATILKRYEGTRLGRQEIGGELLDEYEGALWKRAQIEARRVTRAPALRRVVVGVDPAATSKAKSNNTGIITAALGDDGMYYVLRDDTVRALPADWARAAVTAYHISNADRVVAEVNNGGEMVETVIRVVDPNVSYKAVRAAHNKHTRAEPIAALYEASTAYPLGRVRHVGTFPQLEDELVTWDPLGDMESPDRLDALVWALTELHTGYVPSMDLDPEALGVMRPNPYAGY